MKALFLSMTYFPTFGVLRGWSKVPGSQHVHMRCLAKKGQKPEFQEVQSRNVQGFESTIYLRNKDQRVHEPLGRRSQPVAFR